MALVMTMAKGLAGGGLSIAGVIDRMCGDQSIGQGVFARTCRHPTGVRAAERRTFKFIC